MTQPSVADLTHTVPDGIISAAQLRTAGVTTYAMSTRCRPSGPWQRLLPGVILLSRAEPTRRQRLRAALVYAGQDAVLSGVDAMRAQGVDVPAQEGVLVLAPAGRRVTSQAYLTVERTTRPRNRCGQAAYQWPRWCGQPWTRPDENPTTHVWQRCCTPRSEPAVHGGGAASGTGRGQPTRQRGSAVLLTDEALRVVPVALGLARRLIREAYLPMPAWQFPVHDRTGLPLEWRTRGGRTTAWRGN